jgi:hypothetical protein
MPAKTKRSRVRKRVHLSPQLALRLTIDDAVLTLEEWLVVNNFSPRTAQRILHSPDAPIITRLSAQKLGVTVSNNRSWQQSRTRVAS